MSANKEGKKPQYKDYVNFLDTYKNGKRDESSCHSLTNSSNNSSSSINSDHLNEQPTKGFKQYLENYENKKFSSVKPTFLQQSDGKKTVKTEIFVNINNDQTCVRNNNKVSESLTGIHGTNNNTVNKVTKIFEKESDSERITKTVAPKVNESNSQLNETETDGSELKNISVEEISKKFQANTGNNENTFETKRTTLKKQNSIKEKSKMFENDINEVNDKQQSKKNNPVKQNSTKENSRNIGVQKVHASTTSTASLPPKPTVLKIERSPKIIATVIVNGGNESSVNNGKNADTLRKIVSPPHNIVSQPIIVSLHINCPPPPPPPIPNFSGKSGTNNFPIPPPLPNNQNQRFQVNTPTLNKTSKSSTLSSTASPPPVKKTSSNGTTSIPIPPPPPPSSFPLKSNPILSPKKTTITNGFNNKTNNTTGYSTLPRMNSNKPKDGDAIPVPTLDKNDPRVKKLVYGALREMYGAYHGQANDYLATLPKNRVRKNNGLDRIINSIASQGGLEKLSGRANPNTKNEVANQ